MTQVRELTRKLLKTAPQFGVSLFLHLIAFSMLALYVIETQGSGKTSTILTSEIVEEEKETIVPKEIEDVELDPNTPVNPSANNHVRGGAQGSEGGGPLEIERPENPQLTTASVRNNPNIFNRPLRDIIDEGEIENTPVVPGITKPSDDSGAIEQISIELMRQLTKNKVIVAWILDSTNSLKERREAIAKKLDRVYHELDEMGANKNDALLTAVVSTGSTTKFITEQPTNRIDDIRRAFRNIGDDGTGVENLFGSVRDTAMKYRRFQTHGRRTLVLVLLTDEVGDDAAQADETAAMLKRNEVPLYVLGPMASFSRETIHDWWVDPKTKFGFLLPMKRGPYTRQEELVRISRHWHTVAAGFGPFALSQLTRETGGIFFAYSDTRLKSPDYSSEVLFRYHANYADQREYIKECTISPLRRTLMDVAGKANAIWSDHFPYHWIHEQTWKDQAEARQQECTRYLEFAEKAIPMLEQVEAEWERETLPRWQANYDLSMARLLHAKVRADEMNWAAADFRLNPRTLKDPKNNNGWHIEWVDGMRAATKPGDKSGKEIDSKLAETNRKLLEKAMFHYARVLDKHQQTPWHYCAKMEMTRNVAVNWKEGFDRHYTRLEDRSERNKVKIPPQ